MGSQIDNMEGLSVHRDSSRRIGADADLRRQFFAAAADVLLQFTLSGIGLCPEAGAPAQIAPK
jgi:hypothetical protein